MNVLVSLFCLGAAAYAVRAYKDDPVLWYQRLYAASALTMVFVAVVVLL